MTLRDVGFGALALAVAVFVLPVQFASMIAADSTGLDATLPDFVFMALVPAVVMTLLPPVVAARFYDRRRAGVLAGGLLVVYLLLAAYLQGLYGVCGAPTC